MAYAKTARLQGNSQHMAAGRTQQVARNLCSFAATAPPQSAYHNLGAPDGMPTEASGQATPPSTCPKGRGGRRCVARQHSGPSWGEDPSPNEHQAGSPRPQSALPHKKRSSITYRGRSHTACHLPPPPPQQWSTSLPARPGIPTQLRHAQQRRYPRGRPSNRR